jgi:uncharacterized membrane protein YeaQ/YmgE (transglycosylase-associated protein family)
MYLMSWIFVGLAGGWLAGSILKGNPYPPVMDIILGIGGAVAAGFMMHSVGFVGYQGTILTTLVAMIGALLVTVLSGFVTGRKLSARQL